MVIFFRVVVKRNDWFEWKKMPGVIPLSLCLSIYKTISTFFSWNISKSNISSLKKKISFLWIFLVDIKIVKEIARENERLEKVFLYPSLWKCMYTSRVQKIIPLILIIEITFCCFYHNYNHHIVVMDNSIFILSIFFSSHHWCKVCGTKC